MKLIFFFLNKRKNDYFTKKYYLPELPTQASSKLINLATSSIDISDGLFGDLSKLINKSKLFYKVDLNKIPISSNMKNYLNKFKKKKINFISKGDDYQIIFTSPKSKRNYIQKIFKKMNQKVTLIGYLTKVAKNNEIINADKRIKPAYNEGYSHNF